MPSEDLLQYERLYSLPDGRPRPSRKNIDHHFKLIKKLKNGGGLNEGINIVRYKKNNNLFVQKKLPSAYRESEREILFLNVLKHPDIITYIDAYIPLGRSHAGASLYMEYCELGTLQDLIEKYLKRNRQNPREPHAYIPERFVWHVLESMASALLYIHHGVSPDDYHAIHTKDWSSIVHRDIKPDNIFLRKSPDAEYPVPVLADFGCATHFRESDFNDKQRSFIGTKQYSPPESDRQVARADIWALGAVILSLCWLFELGPKQAPPPDVKGHERSAMWKSAKFKRCIYESETGLGDYYSDDLALIVGRCTQWKKENRPLAHAIQEFVEEHKPRGPGKGRSRGLPSWAFKKS